MHVLKIAEVQERPQVLIAAQNDVPAPAAVAAVGACGGVEFGAHKMLAACAAMAAPAEDAYEIYEVFF